MNSLIRLQRYSFAVRTYSNFYGGEFVPSKATKFFEVYNPVTQEHIARSPQSTEEEFNAVVASAKEAFPAWSRVPLLSTNFAI
jgi:malonate-semialdehyde dehydrogenase (acetylating)/methylmalonate-semialdehyde dehydrogenase